MIWLICILAYVAIGYGVSLLLREYWHPSILDEEARKHRGEFILYRSAFWLITVPGMLVKIAINMPEARRKRELAREHHRTAIAEQRALQAEAANRQYRASGLPRTPGT